MSNCDSIIDTRKRAGESKKWNINVTADVVQYSASVTLIPTKEYLSFNLLKKC